MAAPENRTRIRFKAGFALLVVALILLPGSRRPQAAASVYTESAELAEALAIIAAGGELQNPVTVDWRMLRTLDYRTGEMPAELKALDGKEVRIPGFMVPLEDWAEEATEFLLVPFFGACIHVPPPPPNQLVYVEMANRRKAKVNMYDPVWVVGRLKIDMMESVYGAVGFQLTGMEIKPYDP
jgi:uncharacterized protein